LRWPEFGKEVAKKSITLESPKGTPLAEFKAEKGKPIPVKVMKFPDGKEYTIKYWKDLIFYTAKWFIDTDRLKKSDCPVTLGSRYLVSLEAKHPNGKNFYDPKKIKEFYVECNTNAENSIRRSKRLLEKFNVNPKEVILE